MKTEKTNQAENIINVNDSDPTTDTEICLQRDDSKEGEDDNDIERKPTTKALAFLERERVLERVCVFGNPEKWNEGKVESGKM